MTVALLDVNVLVALAWPSHVHHETAQGWFRNNQRAGWATCPLTQSGFVRVSSNPRVIDEAKTPREAIRLLEQIVALPHHVFWRDDVALARSKFVAPERILGYRQVTDAHLLAVALRHGGRLATFDEGLRAIVPRGHDASRRVCLVSERSA